MTTTPDTCPTCLRPKRSESSGSLTQWIAGCTCELTAKSDVQRVTSQGFCLKCGKRNREGHTGSFTQFIFRYDLCDCEVPELLRRAHAGGPVVQQNESAIIEDIEDELELGTTHRSFPKERYKPIEIIGKGTSGTAFFCRDRLLNKKVIVKMLHVATNEDLVKFDREAKVLSKLSHPNIVRILDFGVTTDGAAFMVFDYASGTSLKHHLELLGTLPWLMVRSIFLQLTDALSYCHAQGVFHRDLKPSNVAAVLGEEPQAELIDFGVALTSSQTNASLLDEERAIVGTPNYMPPDQLRGESYDERSEVYSLGCVLFECLTGVPPFEGETALETLSKHARENPPAIADFVKDSVPAPLIWIVDRCLEKEKEKRFQSMKEMHEALALFQSSAQQLTTEHVKQPGHNRKPWMFAVAGLCLAAVASIALLSWIPMKSSTEKEIPPPEKESYTAEVMEPLTEPPPTACTVEKIGPNFYRLGGNITAADFESLANEEELGNIGFNRGQVSDPSIVDWEGLAKLGNEKIHTLSLLHTTFGDAQVKYLRNFPHLTFLDLSQTNITDKGLQELVKVKALGKLNVIVLNRTRVEGAGIRALGELKHLTGVHLIEMPRISREDLAVLHSIPKLSTVFLDDTECGDGGMKLLKGLRLKVLSANQCKISDLGLNYISDQPLETLYVDDNAGITDAGINAILKHKKLKQLSCRNVNISDQLRNRLKAQGIYRERTLNAHSELLEQWRKDPIVQLD